MGFDAFMFGRLDYQDKNKRILDKELEYVWRPMYDSLGSSVQIFAHTLYYHYSCPIGLDFDTLSDDSPFITDESLDTYNAPKKALMLHEWIVH